MSLWCWWLHQHQYGPPTDAQQVRITIGEIRPGMAAAATNTMETGHPGVPRAGIVALESGRKWEGIEPPRRQVRQARMLPIRSARPARATVRGPRHLAATGPMVPPSTNSALEKTWRRSCLPRLTLSAQRTTRRTHGPLSVRMWARGDEQQQPEHENGVGVVMEDMAGVPAADQFAEALVLNVPAAAACPRCRPSSRAARRDWRFPRRWPFPWRWASAPRPASGQWFWRRAVGSGLQRR